MRHRSNDPATLSHIERRYFVNATISPGGSLRYGSWEDSEDKATRCTECYGSGSVSDRSYRDKRCDVCRGTGRVRAVALTLIEYATGSDYSGTLVEISNAITLKEKFPWLIEVYGGHGTQGLAYLGKRENQNPELIEAIDSLTEYCIFDDDHHSHLEMETVDTAWNDDGRDDFKRALVKYFDAQYEPDEHDLDGIIDERIDRLWRDATERLCGGEDHINESGDSIYFPISDVINKFERCYPGMSKPGYDGTSPSLDAQLLALATAATIPVVHLCPTRYTWRCLTCTQDGSGVAPVACPYCLSECDDNHGPKDTTIAACGVSVHDDGGSNADINFVTCESCTSTHNKITSEGV